jgi:hypothetical protein
MDRSARDFRLSRLGVLEFLSDVEAQRSFAQKVHYDAYSPEFYSWWFDDFAPDSELFTSAFSPTEIERLRRFSEAYSAADAELGDQPRSIQELQGTPQWARAMLEAKEALEVMDE